MAVVHVSDHLPLSKVLDILPLHPRPGLFTTECTMMQHTAILPFPKHMEMAGEPPSLRGTSTVLFQMSRLCSLLFGMMKSFVPKIWITPFLMHLLHCNPEGFLFKSKWWPLHL